MQRVSKNDELCLKTRNFALNIRNCVPKTRSFVFKMMNFAEATARRELVNGEKKQVVDAKEAVSQAIADWEETGGAMDQVRF